MSQMVLIEEDKLKEYECLADELDFYKKKKLMPNSINR